MRDVAIVEIGIREAAAYCGYAETVYGRLDRSGGGEAVETFALVHAFLANCGMVARLLWSREFAAHAGGRTLADLIGMPAAHRLEDDMVRELLDRYDIRLARGLAHRGEIVKILDSNIGDRDAFEEEGALFLRHYDPSVDTLTLTEEELHLGQLAADMAEIRTRAEVWLTANATLEVRPAEPSIPPRR